MMNLNYLMVLRLYRVHHKKNTKHYPLILLFTFTSTKDGYKLELQIPETMKLFGNIKK